MKRKLVLLTEIIAPYRIPVFNALAECEGIDLHVIFLAENDPSLRQWHVYKDEILFSYQVLPSWRARLAKHPVLLNWGLRGALRRTSPHVILCGGYNYLASCQALFWARQKQVPFLAWVESNAQDHRSRNSAIEALKRKFLRSCAAFVVPGKASLEYISNYSVPRHKIFTAPNAVDSDLFFAARKKHADRPTFDAAC